jgi:hypothetical protein
MQTICWIVAVLSIGATIANVYQKAWGFAVWAITDIFWVVVNIRSGYKTGNHELYAQASLFLVYFVIAVLGFIKWRRNDISRSEAKS